ncbi:MAG: SpoVR family protein [Ardenticatenia bacterium]|nr:SpoVR family protein [Ardenticatenia bacterium]
MLGSTTLPPELEAARNEIRRRALDLGLDFFEVIFEMVDFKQMNELAAYMGFPRRYPHWRWGMEYERLKRSYEYGLHKIYEMVINTDPCYAYLLANNELVDQKIVMAHVYAHSDFFKNNLWFAHTNRRMLDEMANHATRVSRYIDRYGLEEVEDFLDICLSLENLIDRHSVAIRRHPPPSPGSTDEDEEELAIRHPEVPRLQVPGAYMDRYVNPPELLRAEAERRRQEARRRSEHVPPEPERDVLLFLLEHAPLKTWQHDVLSIVREEAYYFAPQGMTKVMNEGWASYWHSTIMTQTGVMTDAEVVDYADHHAGTVAMSLYRINPYKIGLELFRDIEERWNKGQFGKAWEECDDMQARREWDLDLGLGRQKIFEVRRVYNDVGFIDTFFTEEFCNRHRLFTYKYNERTNQYEIDSRDFQAVKQKLLFSLTNFGYPIIYVADANYRNRGELYLVHQHEGVDLDLDYARPTLVNLYRIWRRPVHVETVVGDVPRLLSFDGKDHAFRKLERRRMV